MTVKIENLTKYYKKNKALDNVSMTFDKGVYGLLGENGAGKSTLLKCICGLEKYKGSIELGISKDKIGYMPQEFDLLDNLSVEENMEFFRTYAGGDKSQIEELLELTDLTDERKKKAGSLSGGMKRRLGLAISLLGSPELLIMDEPTAGLDPKECIRFRNMVNRISTDKCVIITTHIVQDVENLCTRLVVLNKGNLVFDDEASEIAKLAEGKVYTISLEEAEKRGLLDDIVENRMGVSNLVRVVTDAPQPENPEQPTIEDGYLCLLKNI